jgi:UDP-glucose 4-epimerase
VQTVVITGAGGFLGGYIADAFTAAGWKVTGIGRSDSNQQSGRFAAFHRDDLSDVPRLLEIFNRETPDALVHLAAPASVPESIRDSRRDFLAHTIPLLTVLEALRLGHSGARIVVASSAAVYGDPESLPVTEDAPTMPISPYGFHKVQQELLLREYVRIHRLRGCAARIFSTYGEGLRRLAVWDVTRRALAGAHEVLGTGDETRDYLYAGDVGRAIVAIVERAAFDGEPINVASGQEVSIRTLAAEVYRLAGIAAEPRFTGEKLLGSPSHWRADISKLRSLGFDPPSWSRGLAETVSWIRAQTASVDHARRL